MTQFSKHILANGLTLLVHEDKTTPMAVVNILYKVGARNEDPHRTGFAHLFEHLMFSGSMHVPSFDGALQLAGGDNNAFTNTDVTNYYDQIPVANLETALFLEADRMEYLNINAHSLEVQRKVVIEEFRENYLNQPYGNVWHLLRKMAYKVHPYKWPTIGAEISHIAEAGLEEVQQFFDTHYVPANAILCIAGNITSSGARALAEQYFGKIAPGNRDEKPIPEEPPQQEKRTQAIFADVPVNALYMAFHTVDHFDKDYYPVDLLSDILSNGKSSRLHRQLVKERKLFSQIEAYVTGSIDKGLLVIEGKLKPGVKMNIAEDSVWEIIKGVQTEPPQKRELEKVINKVVSAFEFGEISLMSRAFHLCYYEMLGDAQLLNEEMARYESVTSSQVQQCATRYLVPANCSVLYYHAKRD